MTLHGFRVINYCSFDDTGVLALHPHLNLVVGRNNVGKTALLDALTPPFQPRPHLTPATQPDPRNYRNVISKLLIDVEITNEELWSSMDSMESNWIGPSQNALNGMSMDEFFTELISKHKAYRMVLDRENHSHGFHVDYSTLPYEVDQENPLWIKVAKTATGGFAVKSSTGFGSRIDNFALSIPVSAQLRHVFRFKAERYNVAQNESKRVSGIGSTGENLAAYFANILQSNKPLANEIVRVCRHIVPEIGDLSADFVEDSNVAIYVWPNDEQVLSSFRKDLAIRLDHSGSGIAQVLAIVAKILSAEGSELILIDEPQTFLHPAALRELMSFISSFSMHQFVVTTHSQELISYPTDMQVIHVQKEGSVSSAKVFSSAELADLSYVLHSLGTRIADVFGADFVFWTEGPTEEVCFPEILQHFYYDESSGVTFRAIGDPDLFRRKDAKHLTGVIQKFATSGGLLGPRFVVTVDRETLSDQRIGALEQASQGRLSFFPGVCYEEYLLHDEAICRMITDHLSDIEVTALQVEKTRLETCSVEGISPANILSKVVEKISEGRLEYRKVQDGLWLTKWLLEHDAEVLVPVATWIRDRVAGKA